MYIHSYRVSGLSFHFKVVSFRIISFLFGSIIENEEKRFFFSIPIMYSLSHSKSAKPSTLTPSHLSAANQYYALAHAMQHWTFGNKLLIAGGTAATAAVAAWLWFTTTRCVSARMIHSFLLISRLLYDLFDCVVFVVVCCVVCAFNHCLEWLFMKISPF